jgi:transposase
MARVPRKIDPTIRSRAVRLVSEYRSEFTSERAVTMHVAQSLGLSRSSVQRWVQQEGVDAGVVDGVTTDERAELRRLRSENRRLRDVNEILRQATIFFAGELDPRNR